jgi:magnesium chelatase family protein
MLARRMPGILPPLGFEEALTVTTIHSIVGLLPAGGGLMRLRPFRAPHHTCSDVALVGGGSMPRPGELSLAHGGVLFLDELPEFRRHVLETLRQPLELGTISIARASRTVSFPARVILVAAMNPCECGFRGDSERLCRCTPAALARYQGRISGPLRDRFDLSVEVAAVPWRDLRGGHAGETTATVRERVLRAQERQMARQARLNSRLDGRGLREACRLTSAIDALLARAMARYHLSVRGVYRILRVARTIADLAGVAEVETCHVAEALQFRLPAAQA